MTFSDKIFSIFHYTPSQSLKEKDAVPLTTFKVVLSQLSNENHVITEKEKRETLFKNMIIRENIVDLKGRILLENVPQILKEKTDKMLSNQQRYAAIAHKFANPGLKWWIIAVLHEMECTQNFNCHLHNGDPLTRRTVHVPKGRPINGKPPFSFEFSAIDALRYQKVDLITDWSIGNVLYFLEGYNGYGYEKYRGINSPYLWSGSTNYISGKYISDNVYSSQAVSQQIGIALLIKDLSNKADLSPTL